MFLLEARIDVYVTAVESQGDRLILWVQTDFGAWAKIESLLQSFEGAEAESRINNINPGDIYLAKYDEDGSWYRAQVLSTEPSSSQVTVNFIDFGNSENVSDSAIVKAPSRFFDLPPQAQKFLLDDILPANDMWSKEELEYLKVNLLNAEFTGKITKESSAGSPPFIQLFDGGSESLLVHNFIHQGIGKKIEAHAYPLSIPNMILNVDEICDVVVSYSESPLSFWIQLVKNMESLDDLQAKIASGQNEPSVVPTQLCVAKYDGFYYRAVITALNASKAECSVTFIDYGNSDKVATSGIMRLEPPHSKFPAQAIPCCLVGEDVGKSNFNDIVNTENLKMRVQNILDSGVHLVKFTDDQTQTTYTKEHKTRVQHENNNDAVGYKTIDVEKNKLMDVCISYVDKSGDFYCQLLANSENINALTMDLQSVRHSQLKNISEGMACIAQSVRDDLYYRAQVLGINRHKVMAQFVDFGESESVLEDKIFQLTENIAKHPKQAIWCSLTRSSGAESVPVLNSYKGSPLLAVALRQKGNTIEVELIDTSSNEDIRLSDLIHSPLPVHSDLRHNPKESKPVAKVTPIKVKVPESDIKVGTEEMLYVTKVISDTEFFGQLMKYSQDMLDSFQVQLNEYYTSRSVPTIKNPQPGDVCCAIFSEDGLCYRGRVIKSDQRVKVMFIDYGNIEEKSPADVKELAAELCELPEQGITCRLTESYQGLSEVNLNKAILEQEICVTIQNFSGNAYQVLVPSSNILNSFKKKQRNASASPPPTDVFKKLLLPNGTAEEVIVVHMEDPEHFYCQLVSNQAELDILMDKLHIYGNSTPEQVQHNIGIGVPMIAKYSADDTWYRATVTGVMANGNVEVTFVDYGNHDVIKRSSLRPVQSEFMKLPCQTIHCYLMGVFCNENGIWPQDNTDLLWEFVSNISPFLVINEYDDIVDHYGVELFHKEHNINDKFGKATGKLDKSFRSSGRPTQSLINEMQTKGKPIVNQAIGNTWAKGFEESSKKINEVSNTNEETRLDNCGGREKQTIRSSSRDPGLGGGNWNNGVSSFEGASNRMNDFGSNRNNQGSGFGSQKQNDWGAREETSRNQDRIDPRGSRDNRQSGSHFGGGQDNRRSGFGGGQDQDKGLGEGRSRDHGFERSRHEHSDHTKRPAGTSQNWDQFSKPSFNRSDPSQDNLRASSNIQFSVTSQPKLQLVENQFIDILVSYAIDPGSFWCQLKKSSQELDSLMESLSAEYDVLGPHDLVNTHVSKTQLCCAKYSADDGWYRAKILDDQGDSFQVLFVDYGNSEKVKKTDMKLLKESYLHLPIQAFQCSLSGVQPNDGKWSAEAITKFHGLTLEKQLVACIVEKTVDRCVVELIDQSKHIHEELVKAGLAKNVVMDFDLLSKKGQRRLSSTSNSSRASNASKSSQQDREPKEIKELQLPEGKPVDVNVAFVETPTNFWVHLTLNTDQLQELMDSIGMRYDSLKEAELAVSNTEPGLLCCAKYSEDNLWYRAIVKESQSSKVKVHFIDYGNEEWVMPNNIKYLEAKFTSSKAQGIHCSLYDINPVGKKWNDDAIDLFDNLTSDKNLVAEVISKSVSGCQIRLVDVGEQGAVSIGDELVKKGHAICSSKKIFKTLDINMGTLYTVLPSWVYGPQNFFLQLKTSASSLVLLSEEMFTFYQRLKLSDLAVVNQHIGQACVAYYAADGNWCRSTILKLRSNEAIVLYVDYGNKARVPLSKVKEITSAFLEMPCQSVKCHLHGIDVAEDKWTDEAIATFQKAMSNMLSCKFVSMADGVYTVELIDENGVSVAENLNSIIQGRGPIQKTIKAKQEPVSKSRNEVIPTKMQTPIVAASVPTPVTATTRRDFSLRICPSGEVEVYVTSVVSPALFYVQLASEASDLGEFSELVNSRLASAPALHSPSIHSVCGAKFSEDGMWYRGTITNISNNQATVRFVDFGNTDVVSTAELRQLVGDMLTKVPYCLECGLPGASEQTTGWSADEVKKFEDLTIAGEKELFATFKKKGSTFLVTLRDSETDISSSFLSKAPADAACTHAPLITSGEAPNSSDTLAMFPSVLVPSATTAVYISQVDYPDAFYVNLADQSDALDAIMNQLGSFVSGSPVTKPTIGMACAAVFAEDETWYRASVISEMDDKYEVCFVDYGNTGSVTPEKIAVLPEKLLNIPPFAMMCCLDGIDKPASGWPADIAVKILKLSGDGATKLSATFITTTEPCKVKLMADTVDINKEIQTLISSRPTTGDQPNTKSNLPTLLDLMPLPSALKLGKYQVMVVHVEDPSEFYLQLARDNVEIEQLVDSVDTRYGCMGDDEMKLEEPALGQLCCAKYSANGLWHRAVIHSKTDDGYCVKFLDFGNGDVVQQTSLKELKNEYQKIPAKLYKCSLYGISDSCEYKDEIVDKLANLTESKILTAEVMRVNDGVSGVVVSLWDKEDYINIAVLGDQYVSDKLDTVTDTEIPVETRDSAKVSENAGHTQQQQAENLSAKVDDVGLLYDGKAEGDGLEDKSVFADISTVLKCGDREEVYATEVKCPSNFWCQKAGSSEWLDTLLDELYNHYDGTSEGLIDRTDIQEEQMCAAKFADEQWYRAKIISIDDNTATVFFVDYGNKSSVAFNDIRTLESRFHSTPHQAMECVLDEIEAKEGSWSLELVAKFRELINDKKLLLEVKAILDAGQGDQMPIYVVRLLDMGISVSQLLLDLGLAEKKASNDDLSPKRVDVEAVQSSSMDAEILLSPPRQSVPVAYGDRASATRQLNFSFAETPKKVQETKVPQFVTFNIGSRFESYVSHVESINEFYLQQKSSSEELQLLVDLMQEYCKVNDDKVDCLEEHQIVVAKSVTDEIWYRARIFEFTADFVTVQYVDYGNIEKVKRETIQSVMQDFRELPFQAVQCKLYGVVPRDKIDNNDDIDAFTIATNDKCVMAEVKEEDDQTYVVSLLDMGQSVAKTLLDQDVVEADELTHDVAKLDTTLDVAHGQEESLMGQQDDDHKLTNDTDDNCVLEGSAEDDLSSVEGKQAKELNEVNNTRTDDVEASHNDDLNDVKETTDNLHQVAETAIMDLNKVTETSKDLDKTEETTDGFNEVEDTTTEDDLYEFEEGTVDLDAMKISTDEVEKTDLESEQATSNDLGKRQEKIDTVKTGEITTSDVEYLESQVTKIGEYSTEVVDAETPESLDGEPYAESWSYHSTELTKEVYISSAETPHDFWCQVAQLSDEQLPLHQDRIQDYCSTAEPASDFLDELQPGAACMALCKDVWYRARITQIKEDHKVDVLFVDYGNSEVVPRSDLRPVCEELMELPVQAFHCKLSGIKPLAGREWDEASCNRFHELVLLEEAKVFQLCTPNVLKDEDGVKFVEGHLIDGEINVADLLVEGGYAQSSCDNTEIPAEIIAKRTGETQIDKYSRSNIDPDLEKEMQTMVANVIKLAQDELAFGKSSDAEEVNISDAAKTVEPGAESTSGDVKDDLENSVIDEPTLESQAEHEKLFLEVSINRCHSFGSLVAEEEKDDPSEDLCQPGGIKLEDMVQDAHTSDHVKEDTPVYEADDNSQQSGLTEEEGFEDAEEGWNNEADAMKPVFASAIDKRTLVAGQKYDALVSHVVDPDHIWCQVDADDHGDLLQEMAEYYKHQNLGTESWSEGNVCCFQASAEPEDHYERAQIQSCYGEFATVLLVDEGKLETVDLKNLHPLLAKFAELNRFAVECQLHGIKALSESWSDDIPKEIMSEHGLVTMDVISVDETSLQVVLMSHNSGSSIADQLVNHQLARRKSVSENITTEL